METRSPILFYDGTCGFCNGTVQWVLRNDRRARLRFAPLQGSTYAALDVANKPTDLSTIVLVENDRLYTRTSATVRMLRAMGGVWSLLGSLLWLIPKPLRDLGYRLIARNRYRLAGRVEACSLPTGPVAARMLP